MAEVKQLGVKVRAQQLRPSEVGDLGELLLQSLDDDVVNEQSPFARIGEEQVTTTVAPQPAPRPGETLQPLTSLVSSFVEPRYDISVNVLGSVDVIGGKAPLDRRQAELVAFLALHPHGVTDEQIKTALWPDKLPALSTFNNLVSTARTKLGTTDNGDLYVPLAYDGRYLVSPLVSTDLGRFRARVAYARAATGDDQLATLRDAIRLVRGQVFSGVSRGFEWVSTRGLLVSIEAEVVDAAHLLAQLCIARGDLAGAHEAINLGLLVSPLNEVLVRDRMLAFDHAGNPTGVEATMRDLCDAIDVEGPISNDDVHPETYALYERLTRRRRTAGVTAPAN
jgi:DNA-binding SARP family transcriptional activator